MLLLSRRLLENGRHPRLTIVPLSPARRRHSQGPAEATLCSRASPDDQAVSYPLSAGALRTLAFRKSSVGPSSLFALHATQKTRVWAVVPPFPSALCNPCDAPFPLGPPPRCSPSAARSLRPARLSIESALQSVPDSPGPPVFGPKRVRLAPSDAAAKRAQPRPTLRRGSGPTHQPAGRSSSEGIRSATPLPILRPRAGPDRSAPSSLNLGELCGHCFCGRTAVDARVARSPRTCEWSLKSRMPALTLVRAKSWSAHRPRSNRKARSEAAGPFVDASEANSTMPQQPQPKHKGAPPASRPAVAPLQPLAPGTAARSASSASSLPSPHHSRHRSNPSPSPRSATGPSHPPMSPPPVPPPSRSRPTTPDPMQELRYRHALEMQAVKRQTVALRDEKAYLMAQNLRLHRELAHDRHPAAPTSSRERDSSRPPLSRSFSHPNAEVPRGGVAAMATVTSPPVVPSRPASVAPLAPSARPRTPSSHGAYVHHVPHPSLDNGHHHQSRPSTGSAAGDYPFPMSRRSSASGYSAAPDPAALSRPASIRSSRSRTGSLASSGRITPASLSSASGVLSTPATASTRGRSVSRPASAVGGGASSDNLKGILKPPRSSSREARMDRGGGRSGYISEDAYDTQPPSALPSGPRRRMSFDGGRPGGGTSRSARPSMFTSF